MATPSILLYGFIFAISLLVCIEDLARKRLSDALTLGSLPILYLILFLLTLTHNSQWGRLLTALIGATLLALIYLLLHVLNPKGFGLGDVKFSLFVGSLLGWRGFHEFTLGALLPFLMAGVFAAGILVFTKKDGRSTFAFGPFMVLGMWVALLV